MKERPFRSNASRAWRCFQARLAFGSFIVCFALPLYAQDRAPLAVLQGQVRDEAGVPSTNSTVVVGMVRGRTNDTGRYSLHVPVGHDLVEVLVGATFAFRLELEVSGDRNLDIDLSANQTVQVNTKPDVLLPDPAMQGYAHSELLDANPGRPGVPFSVPGYPTETASGGIKAPQYFAPGVSGDHGEPIAQYIKVASFLLPNNLTANAHGNGYADPNFLISGVVGGVLVDGGAFNARYGDHAINLAVTYDLRSEVQSALFTSTTGKDVAFGGTLHLGKSTWIAGETLFGNGWLKRPEERQQYKFNAFHDWSAGNHQFTLFGVGYYGFSRIPGLVPLGIDVSSGTVDARQSDLTHTSILTFVDHWQPAATRSLDTGTYFRTYSLNLRSNFGDGLIRQGEFRTVIGGTTAYVQELSKRWTLLVGLEERRDAPRNLILDHFDEAAQTFTPVSKNNVTIYTTAPFGAISGDLLPGVHLYAGLRRDQLCFVNTDLLVKTNSFNAWPSATSPKVNLTFGAPSARYLPQFGFSFAKAFHANDPRISSGTNRGQLIATAREYQVFATKSFGSVQARLTLGQVRSSSEFAKIDPDTGLQENVGPGQNRFLTLQLNQRSSTHFWQVSWSQADARDRDDSSPLAEAPRMIVDAIAGTSRLPFRLSAKGELEYVKAKPLGDGFVGVPLRELRFNLTRSLQDGRWTVSADGQYANGYSGQTLETLSLDSQIPALERPVGVPVASYATVGLRYNFSK